MRKQKPKTRSSTKAELVGIDDAIAKTLRSRYFLNLKGYTEKQGQRRSFILKCKHELIAKIEGCHEFFASLDEACQKFSIDSRYYHQWKKQLDHVHDLMESNVRKMHSLDDFLLRYVFKFCEKRMVVTT